MPDQFIPQRVRIGLIEVEGACGIGSSRRGRKLHDVFGAVAERDVAPVAQLLIGPKRVPYLLRYSGHHLRVRQLVLEGQRSHGYGRIGRLEHLCENPEVVDIVNGSVGQLCSE